MSAAGGTQLSAENVTTSAFRLRRNRARRYAAGVLSGYAARLLAPALGLLVTPFALARLGRDGFGAYALAASLVAWLTLLDFGLAGGLNLELARAAGRWSGERVSKLTSSALAAQFACAALLFGAGMALSEGFAQGFGLPEEMRVEAALLVKLLAAGAAVSAVSKVASATLFAHQLIWRDNLARALEHGVRAMLTVVLLIAGWGLAALGAAHLAAALAGLVVRAGACRKKLPELRMRFAWARAAEVKTLARSGVWLSLGSLAGLLIAAADKAVAARLLSLSAVTTLAISAAAFLLAGSLLTQTIDAARPMLAQALGAGRKEEAARIYERLLGAGVGLSVVAAAALCAGNRAFVTAWAGAENYGGGALDAALAASLVLQFWILPNRAALSAALRVRRQTLVRLGEGALNLALSVALASLWGLPGLVWGAAAAAALTSARRLPRMAADLLGCRARAATAKSLVEMTVSAALLAPIAWAAREAVGAEGGFAPAAAAAAVVGAVGCALVWTRALDRETRAACRAFLHRRARRLLPIAA